MVNFYAPIAKTLGYGVHSYNLIRAYSKLNPEISLIPPFGRTLSDEHVSKWLANRSKITRDDIGIMIFNEPFLNQFSGKVRIGFPVFEMEKFDSISLAAMRTCDYLLTPSQWGKQVLKDNGLKDVFVIPEGYDPETFYPNYSVEYKINRIDRQGLTFVHVGKFEERKGTKDVITAFVKAFEYSKQYVNLIMHCQNIFNKGWEAEINTMLSDLGFTNATNYWLKGRLNIKIQTLNIENMVELYRSADFGIFMSKAEGWGLPLMECLACGTPALTTTWTGMSEYLQGYPEELSITKYRKEIANDGMWFKGDRGEWRVPDINETIEKLRLIANKPEEYLRKDINCVDKFTWDNAAKELEGVI